MSQDSPFRLETKRSLAEQVVDRIKDMIMNGALDSGDRLPPEVDLAEQMGVSRTALREGMRTLEAQGLLETRAGVGTVVRSVGADQLAQPLTLFVEASGGAISFEEFHAVRAIMEAEIAALAAANAGEDDLVVLRKSMAEMEATADDGEAFASADASFHQTLANMTGNPLLELFLGALRVLLEEHIRQVVVHIDPATDVLPYHAAILTAVEDGDENRARDAMKDHLRKVRENYYMAHDDKTGGGQT